MKCPGFFLLLWASENGNEAHLFSPSLRLSFFQPSPIIHTFFSAVACQRSKAGNEGYREEGSWRHDCKSRHATVFWTRSLSPWDIWSNANIACASQKLKLGFLFVFERRFSQEKKVMARFHARQISVFCFGLFVIFLLLRRLHPKQQVMQGLVIKVLLPMQWAVSFLP